MATELRYAGLGRRFLALLVDFLCFCIVFFPITRAVKGVWIMSAHDHRWANGLFITDPLCIGFLIFMLIYFVVLEAIAGATVGKWVVHLRVVNLENGGRPGWVKSSLRNLLRLIDGLPAFNIIGIVLILRSSEKARFGDRVAGTRVIVLNITWRN